MADETICEERWRTGGASVIGAAHTRRGLPNQDAFVQSPGASGDERFLIAVADGHGGQPHFRAEVGAALAVHAVAEVLQWCLNEPESLADLPTDLVALWQKRVRAHLEQHPYAGRADVSSLTPYGTTLIAVTATPQQCVVCQIGDGDVLFGYADGRIERPFVTREELAAEQTYSLCMDNATQFVRCRQYLRGSTPNWPDFALVATDGVSKSFVDSRVFEKVVSSYRDLVRTETDFLATLGALPAWLREVSDSGSGDDASLCLATRCC